MTKKITNIKIDLFLVIASLDLLISPCSYAASTNVSSIEDFLRNVIKAIASLAGLIATGFFVVGGFGYITSSGNPEHLEKAKRTLLYSGIGLAIVIAAFVISNIVVTLATQSFGK